MRRAALALAVALAACAHGGGTSATPESLAAGLVGRWSNSAQIAAAPQAFRIGPAPGAAWIDAREARFTALGTDAVRLDWSAPAGAPRAAPEVWRFARDEAGAITLTIAAAEGAAPDPACALAVRATSRATFDAASDPTRCRTAAGGLERRVTLMSTGLLAQDLHYADDLSSIVDQVPGATPWDLRRAR